MWNIKKKYQLAEISTRKYFEHSTEPLYVLCIWRKWSDVTHKTLTRGGQTGTSFLAASLQITKEDGSWMVRIPFTRPWRKSWILYKKNNRKLQNYSPI